MTSKSRLQQSGGGQFTFLSRKMNRARNSTVSGEEALGSQDLYREAVAQDGVLIPERRTCVGEGAVLSMRLGVRYLVGA